MERRRNGTVIAFTVFEESGIIIAPWRPRFSGFDFSTQQIKKDRERSCNETCKIKKDTIKKKKSLRRERRKSGPEKCGMNGIRPRGNQGECLIVIRARGWNSETRLADGWEGLVVVRTRWPCQGHRYFWPLPVEVATAWHLLDSLREFFFIDNFALLSNWHFLNVN